MRTIRVMTAMDGQTYFRISWRKLICVLGALLVIGAPVLASFCGKDDCSGHHSKADARCRQIAKPRCANSINGQSPLDCCQVNEVPPVALRQTVDAENPKGEFSSVRFGTAPPNVLATDRIISRAVGGIPPHNVQSLLCTLLI